MIGFKEYLIEMTSTNSLYHGIREIKGHVDSYFKNGIEPHTEHDHPSDKNKKSFHRSKIWGISTTRSLRFAKEWAQVTGVVFEFDINKTKTKFKVTPYDWLDDSYRGAGESEQEEFVITKKAIPIKFVKMIHINKRYSKKEYIMVIIDKASELNIPLEMYN